MKSLFVLKTVLTVLLALPAIAMQENTKGLLPEVRLDSNNEDKNQETAFQSEVLITKTENKAIEALTKIIAKKKGSDDEADLLFRLAELYMRRAKSGRFFDLNHTTDKQLLTAGLQNQKAQDALKNAITIYNRLEKNFPKYKSLDAVYFNNAIAHLQTKQTDRAKNLYDQLIASFPKSPLVPDTLLEVGEIYYFQQNFQTALDKFKAIEKYPQSKAYPYGLYKSAWAHYNLKQAESGVNQLLLVVKQNPAGDTDAKKYNLRKEALRDLTLFVGETLEPEQLFGFFQKITTEEELGEAIMALSSLYESHSRYKEINIFVNEFIEKHPSSLQAVKCYAKLVDVNETLKLRAAVLINLKKMAEFCHTQPQPTCHDQFRTAALDISKKWWEIWLKNKKNPEFSKLTEQAFEILLANEDISKPDSKSRYAFAELQFQQGHFSTASLNYEQVAHHAAIDKTMAHDALYGALYSVEKQLEVKDDVVEVERQKMLASEYVTNYANGEHITQIRYKLGFIAYKQNDYDLALASLLP
ncbi:MAG: tetratricopeptide repeat protein, partial [Bdellovibrionaceae bacterium]|nr:tetratricopeptide repeat protein [Bdellovibrio sp.]